MRDARAINTALVSYASRHDWTFPPNLGDLILDGELDRSRLSAFVRDANKPEIPAEILNGTKQQQAAWVNEHTGYKLLRAGKSIKVPPPWTARMIEPGYLRSYESKEKEENHAN
jgi:hypothetical protein